MNGLKILVVSWRITGLVAFVFIILKLIIIQHWYDVYELHNLFGISTLCCIGFNFIIGNVQEMAYGPYTTNRYVKLVFRIAVAILILGCLFKIQHWKGAGLMLIMSIPIIACYALYFCAQRAQQVQAEIKVRSSKTNHNQAK